MNKDDMNIYIYKDYFLTIRNIGKMKNIDADTIIHRKVIRFSWQSLKDFLTFLADLSRNLRK